MRYEVENALKYLENVHTKTFESNQVSEKESTKINIEFTDKLLSENKISDSGNGKLTCKEIINSEAIKMTALITLINTLGKEAYAYIAVRADHLKIFQTAINAGKSINLDEYGKIIESGYGQPSEEVKAKMTKEYGFDHENGVSLPIMIPE